MITDELKDLDKLQDCVISCKTNDQLDVTISMVERYKPTCDNTKIVYDQIVNLSRSKQKLFQFKDL